MSKIRLEHESQIDKLFKSMRKYKEEIHKRYLENLKKSDFLYQVEHEK